MSTFWRSVGVVVTGMATAQAIPLLGLLVLTRQYAPGEFGIFGAWFGVVSIGAVIATGRYEVALPLEEDGEPRKTGVIATMLLALLASAVAGVVVTGLLISGMTLGIAAGLWITGVLGIGLAAIAHVCQAWAGADGRYHDLSIMRITQAAAITAGQIGIGVFMPSGTALVIAHLVGLAAGIAVSLYLLPLSLRHAEDSPWMPRIAAYWARHRRFPALSLPADSLNTVAGQLPLLIVASRFGSDVTGLLALTMRILGGPTSLLGASVLDVFRRSAASSWREHGECRDDFMRTFWILAGGAIGLVLIIGPFGETLFAWVFGETWRAAGTIALWMLPLFAMRFVANPLSYMFYIAGKQHIDLVWQATLLVTTVSTLMLPAQYSSALQSYSLGYSALYLVYLGLSYRFSGGLR